MTQILLRNWETSNNISLYLLRALSDDVLPASVPKGGRSVGQLFRHMIEVRNQWLSVIDAALAGEKMPKQIDMAVLERGLISSGFGISALITNLQDAEAKVKGFRSDLAGFTTYLISHDAHHRGQVLLTLRLAGHRLDSKLSYALWDWPAHSRVPLSK